MTSRLSRRVRSLICRGSGISAPAYRYPAIQASREVRRSTNPFLWEESLPKGRSDRRRLRLGACMTRRRDLCSAAFLRVWPRSTSSSRRPRGFEPSVPRQNSAALSSLEHGGFKNEVVISDIFLFGFGKGFGVVRQIASLTGQAGRLARPDRRESLRRPARLRPRRQPGA